MVKAPTSLSILLLNQAWLAPELRALGHRVVTAGWVNDAFDVRFSRGEDIHDVVARASKISPINRIVYFDDSTCVSLRGLDALRIPSLFYSVDAHHHASWHGSFSATFSTALVAQKDYLSHFIKQNSSAAWLPLWSPRKTACAQERTIDICFRGTLDKDLHPKRADFFDRLQQHITIDAQKGPYYEAYPRAKIVLNQTVSGDLNFRVFEALESGALLITPKIGNGLSELFVPGQDYVEYEEGNVEQLASLCQHYLSNTEERQRIAASGCEKARREHSSEKRAEQLAEHLLALEPTVHNTRHAGAAGAYLYCCISGMLSGKEEITRGMQEHANFREAVQCMIRSFRKNEPLDVNAEVVVLNSMIVSKKLETVEVGINLLTEAILHHPEKVLFRMMELEALESVGLQKEAQARAAEISETPDELLQYSVDTVIAAHQSVWETMREQIR